MSSTGDRLNVRDATAADITAIIARVSSTNTTSLRLTRHCGFADVGTMHEVGVKFGHPVDVVILELLLSREPDRQRG